MSLTSLRNLKLELTTFCESALVAIYKLKSLFPEFSFYFEKRISNEKFNGSVDFLFENENSFGLIDFKRSSFGIPLNQM